MKRFIIILAIMILGYCCFIQEATAVPAYPNKVTVRTDNGKNVEISLKGDEHMKYAMTNDGYSILNDSEGWWYAKQSDNGKAIKSSFKLMAKEDETAELKSFKASCPKGLLPEHIKQTNIRKASNRTERKSNAKIVGERHALVILMQYIDVPFRNKYDDFNNLFNQTDYHVDGATGSVRDYYRFASQGQLDYISDIYGPYTAAHPMRYYGANSTYGGNDSHALELCIEAMTNLPAGIDFSQYDNDGDGVVDNVHIIYAGYGEEAGASSDAIWAHEYPGRISLQNEMGITLAGYSCSPELRGNTGKNITNIGVICHELGHALGAMDYYDTNYGTGGEYEGTGKWDIMASGSWNNEGKTPSNFNPYVRSTVFGWNQQKTLEADQQITMPRMDIDNADISVVYRMETGCNGDYFLLENRQKQLFDAALPGEGLMVYHVHPDIDTHNSTNTVNASHPQCLYPVCASGSKPSNKDYGNIDSDECPFPGSTGKTKFSATSSPAAIAWNGSTATVTISNIKVNSNDGSMSFSTSGNTTAEPDPVDPPVEPHVIYKESFETNIYDRFSTTSISGNETWRKYKKGDFAINAEHIPEPTDGESILMLYLYKGNGINESELTSPYINVNAGNRYTIKFDVNCSATSLLNSQMFSFYIEDVDGEHQMYSINKNTNNWSTVEIPYTPQGNKFRYKLNANIENGGIFVDNIRLFNEDATTILPLSEPEATGTDETEIFRIDGSKVYNNKKDLKPGIYLIRHNMKTRRIMIAR